MGNVARKRVDRTVGKDVEREILSRDELEKISALGLKLTLQSVRRKNPYFKGSRRGRSGMSRKEKRSAMSFANRVVEGYFRSIREFSWIVSPN
jgi:hypothetical protein